jgi:hypothetical protein
MRQSEPNIEGRRNMNGTEALLKHARNCRLLSRRLRIPAKSNWSRRVACNFRDGTEDELVKRRNGKLSAIDFALLDSVYFACAGLAEGYALLGKFGWIDEEKRAFHPVVETIIKLQRELKDDLAMLGLDQPPKVLSLTDCPVCGLSFFGQCKCALPSTIPTPAAEDRVQPPPAGAAMQSATGPEDRGPGVDSAKPPAAGEGEQT